MTFEDAKIVLASMLYEDEFGRLHLAGFEGGEVIEMQGTYTAAELEAIAVWMRAHVNT